MFGNYFKSALRNIAKHKGYSFINITGLAIGMACCLLILMFVNDELSYDNYHENADRIYRMIETIRFGGRDFTNVTCPAPMAKTLVNDYPDIIDAVRFRDSGSFIVKYGDNSFKETRFIFSDTSIFNVFTIPLLQGNPKTALKDPNTLVMSKKTAEKYFGSENPLGKVVKIDNKSDYIVTGVFNKIPSNSHFHYDVIASVETLEESKEEAWLDNNFQTYLLMAKNVTPTSMEAKFPEVIKKYMGPQVEQFLGKPLEKLVESGSIYIKLFLQPLRDIHLHSDLAGELEANGDIKYVLFRHCVVYPRHRFHQFYEPLHCPFRRPGKRSRNTKSNGFHPRTVDRPISIRINALKHYRNAYCSCTGQPCAPLL